jgi:TctA family transporter
MVETLEEQARRWVRRKRTFYTIVVIYLALCVLWFVIDMITGTDDLWFYWPMFGAGVIVVVIGITMFGVSGLFGSEWEGRQVAKFLERQSPADDSGNARTRPTH